MVSFGEDAKIKKAGNLNQGCSYVITTVFIVDIPELVKYYVMSSLNKTICKKNFIKLV